VCQVTLCELNEGERRKKKEGPYLDVGHGRGPLLGLLHAQELVRRVLLLQAVGGKVLAQALHLGKGGSLAEGGKGERVREGGGGGEKGESRPLSPSLS
jgi:hypothetical protein